MRFSVRGCTDSFPRSRLHGSQTEMSPLGVPRPPLPVGSLALRRLPPGAREGKRWGNFSPPGTGSGSSCCGKWPHRVPQAYADGQSREDNTVVQVGTEASLFFMWIPGVDPGARAVRGQYSTFPRAPRVIGCALQARSTRPP